MASVSGSRSRVKHAQRAARKAWRVALDGLTSEEFRAYALGLLRRSAPEEVAAFMRDGGYSEEMVERGLAFVFGDDPSAASEPAI